MNIMVWNNNVAISHIELGMCKFLTCKYKNGNQYDWLEGEFFYQKEE